MCRGDTRNVLNKCVFFSIVMAHFWNSVLLMTRSACQLHLNHCSFFPSFCLFFSFLFFSGMYSRGARRGGWSLERVGATVWGGLQGASQCSQSHRQSTHTHTHKELRLPHTLPQSDEEESGCVQQHYRVLVLSPRRWKRTYWGNVQVPQLHMHFFLKSMHNIWWFIML